MLAKIVLLGSQGVGKTSVLNALQRKKFKEGLRHTVGFERTEVSIGTADGKLNVEVYDTEGNPEFAKRQGNSIYQDANAFLLVIDTTVPFNRKQIEASISEAKNHQGENVKFYVLFNTSDGEVNPDFKGSRFEATRNTLYDLIGSSFHFSVCSAKSGKDVDVIFNQIAKDLKQQQEKLKIPSQVKKDPRIEPLIEKLESYTVWWRKALAGFICFITRGAFDLAWKKQELAEQLKAKLVKPENMSPQAIDSLVCDSKKLNQEEVGGEFKNSKVFYKHYVRKEGAENTFSYQGDMKGKDGLKFKKLFQKEKTKVIGEYSPENPFSSPKYNKGDERRTLHLDKGDLGKILDSVSLKP